MKTLSIHIKESFAPVKEEQQTDIENFNNTNEEIVVHQLGKIERKIRTHFVLESKVYNDKPPKIYPIK